MIDRNLSCPAVSQSCNLIRVPSLTSINLAKKSTPTVGSDSCNVMSKYYELFLKALQRYNYYYKFERMSVGQ